VALPALAVFLVLSLVAEVLGTVGGFGSSVFFVPMAGYFFDFRSVLGITALLHVASNISKLVLFRQGIDKKLALSVGLPAIILVIIGALLSRFVASRWLEIALSVFLVLLSIVFLWRKDWEIPPTGTNAVVGGGVSGFAAGLLGTGGTVRGLVMAAFNLEKEVFVATSALIDFGVDASRAVVYTSQGYVRREHLYLLPFLLVISFVGTWIGKKILARIPQESFRRLVLVLILLIGLTSLIKFLR
jgi:uncharacterized protein